MTGTSKTTPLHGWHVAQGAQMADFGGYQMPLWYSSAKNEHLSVLTSAGMFDTSHMAVLTVAGPDAHGLLQKTFTQNLDACIGKDKAPLPSGRCVYGMFLNPQGEVIDDSIIFKLAEGNYMLVVNAGMGAPIAGHLKKHQGALNVQIADLTDQVGKVDVQGPAAGKIVAAVLADPDQVFAKMPYFAFKGYFGEAPGGGEAVRLIDGTPIMVSRTGYTGEFGFELFVKPGALINLWEALLAAGRPMGLVTCGLAARDSLRGGAVLPLSHQDIGPWPFANNPWLFALPYNNEKTGFTKPFLGDQALLNLEQADHTYAFVGYDLRKVSVADPAVVVDNQGNQIGTVLTCVTDMGIGRAGGQIYSIASPDKPKDFVPKGLCCGFVKVRTHLATGTEVQLKDKRRSIKVVIVEDVRPHRTARRPIAAML